MKQDIVSVVSSKCKQGKQPQNRGGIVISDKCSDWPKLFGRSCDLNHI